MIEGKQQISASVVIDDLRGHSKSRYFDLPTQSIFARAVELLAAAYELPVFTHAVRPGDYAVKDFGVEVQSSAPIQEGDLLTVYVEEGGKVYARPDAEFRERFKPQA